MATSPISQSKLKRTAGRRERRRAEIRERLFRAALRLFAERGYLETTVEDITEAADVGKGTFFNYFPTKDHVLATFGAERIATIEDALEEAKKGPVAPALRRMAVDLAGMWAEGPGLLRAIYAAHAFCPPVRAELHKRLIVGRRLIAEIFALGQERGEIRRDIAPAELARLTQLVLFGVTLAWAMNPDSTLRATEGQVWDLFVPNLLVDEKSRIAKGSRSPKS
ncbi:MAG TPA: TetR/AcrR family transcriptional regulator [Candidatus Acidoferrales bacterium]|jgi:AcrR family transcriptional regulator|nr:TetR/AcrR family transcriptional regulator [Candidatus Acidoferrales bacterium]